MCFSNYWLFWFSTYWWTPLTSMYSLSTWTCCVTSFMSGSFHRKLCLFPITCLAKPCSILLHSSSSVPSSLGDQWTVLDRVSDILGNFRLDFIVNAHLLLVPLSHRQQTLSRISLETRWRVALFQILQPHIQLIMCPSKTRFSSCSQFGQIRNPQTFPVSRHFSCWCLTVLLGAGLHPRTGPVFTAWQILFSSFCLTCTSPWTWEGLKMSLDLSHTSQTGLIWDLTVAYTWTTACQCLACFKCCAMYRS